MSDDVKPRLARGKVALLDPRGQAVNHASHDENGVLVPSDDFMKTPVTREEMLEALPKAALAIGQKMFDQVTSETAELLEQWEHIITQRVTKAVIAELSRWFKLKDSEEPEPQAPTLVVDERIPAGELHAQQNGETVAKIINLAEQ
jgi:hypothetical protein